MFSRNFQIIRGFRKFRKFNHIKFIRENIEMIPRTFFFVNMFTFLVHIVEKYYKMRSLILRKINIFSVKSTFFVLKSWFHEIFWVWSHFTVHFHTTVLWILISKMTFYPWNQFIHSIYRVFHLKSWYFKWLMHCSSAFFTPQ